MKLGDIFKKPQIDDEDGSNPRALSSKMNFKFRRPPIQGGHSTAAPVFVPKWIPDAGDVNFLNYTEDCPGVIDTLYRRARAEQVNTTNVPTYVYFGTDDGTSNSIGFINLWARNYGIQSSNPVPSSTSFDTPDPGVGANADFNAISIGGGFGGFPFWVPILGASPLLVGPNEWFSIITSVITIQNWTSQKIIRLYASRTALDTNTPSSLFVDGVPLFTQFDFLFITPPTGCTTPFASPTNSPDWGSPQSSYF